LEAIRQVEADLADPASSKLSQALCAAASAGKDAPAPCHTELARTYFLEGAELRKNSDEASVARSEQGTLMIVLIVAGSVGFAILMGTICLLRRGFRRKIIKQEMDTVVGAVEVKISKDTVSECGSTATPPSEKRCSEVQTDLSGDISEIASQPSRECTLDTKDGEYFGDVKQVHDL
jgi:hypothetical protein